jgi:8-oxo-dGTP pyrophosphatase MutT (NUDIX family)
MIHEVTRRDTKFSIGAFAILFDDQGRVLLCHRRDRDMWNLPGGGVESGELPTEAVVRETKEAEPRHPTVLP